MKQIKTFTFGHFESLNYYSDDENNNIVNNWLERNQYKIENIKITTSVSYSMINEDNGFVSQTTISYDKVKYQQKPK